jgi:hypothetical protein
MFLFERAEIAITLNPKGDGTEATFEYQFEIVGTLKFADKVCCQAGQETNRRQLGHRQAIAGSKRIYLLARQQESVIWKDLN